MQQAELYIELTHRFIAPTYARYPVCFTKGRGALLFDTKGNSYIDFASGIATVNLGHCHPRITEALIEAANSLWHTSNLYYIPWQAELAELLVKNSYNGKVFFCNSGAEANEAAIKFARLWGKKYKNGAYKIITAKGSFHGRTLATLTATGQEKVKHGFDPLPLGFIHIPYNDTDSLYNSIDNETVAVMLEPIQGEGGVIVPSDTYLKDVRSICDEKNILLILDEVQTGIARSGELFAFKHWNVIPDIMTLAKGLGNGFPIGAVIVGEKVVEAIEPGVHASTFGGNHLATRVAKEVISVVLEEKLWERAKKLENIVKTRLIYTSSVKEIRGKGLLLGIELANQLDSREVTLKCLNKGLLVVPAGEKVVRILPPLTIEEELLLDGINILNEVLST